MPDRGAPERSPWIVRVELFDDHGAIVAVDGDLDLATAPQIEAVIAGMIGSGHRHLVIDLSGATALDTRAMQSLLSALEPLRDEPAAVVALAGCNGAVSRSLTIGRIGEMFSRFDTRGAAISGVTDPAQSLCQTWREAR